MIKNLIFPAFIAILFLFTVGCVNEQTNESKTTNPQVFSAENNLESTTAIIDIISDKTTTVNFQQTTTTKPSAYATNSNSKPTVAQSKKAETYTFVHTFSPSRFDEYDNETPFNKKISVSYDENEIVNKYLYHRYIPFVSGDPQESFDDVNQKYPIECIRKNNENIYAVYKTNQGGLMYMFFTPDMHLYYSAYSMKKLSYADFSNIKAGDSFEKVAAVDPAANAMKTAYETGNDSLVLYTVHVLSDGVFVAFYNESETSGYTVWKCEYYPDYIFNHYEFFIKAKPEYAIDNTDYSYKILPGDYVS